MSKPVSADSLCRACAKIIEENCQYEATKQFQKYQDLYSSLCNSEVFESDDLPRRFCSTCSELLETIINFKDSCAQSIDSIRKLIIANVKEEPQEIVSAEPLEPILKVESEVFGTTLGLSVVSVATRKKVTRNSASNRKKARPMCELCGLTFVDVKGFRRHMKLELTRKLEGRTVKKKQTQTVRKPQTGHPCTIESCRRFCYDRKRLKRHLKLHNRHHDKKSLVVPSDKCSRNFSSESALMKSHKTQSHPPLVCHHCGKVCYTKNDILSHLIKEHLRADETCSICQAEKPSNKYKSTKHLHCTFEWCRRIFLYRKYLDNHLKRHKSPRSESKIQLYACTQCGENFLKDRKLKEHMLTVHPEKTKKVSCKICRLNFLYSSELQAHEMRVHKPLLCHHCGRAFSKRDIILRHIIKEHTDQVYEKCKICNVKLLQSKLMEHCTNIHTVTTSEYIIQCEHCNRVFSKKALLNRHLKIHNGVRKYVCDQCGKDFLRLHSLKSHLNMHSGVRPVHCNYCDKGFYNRHALKIHMNIHKRQWIAEGQTGIELMVYATSNKSKNSNEKKYANLKQPYFI